MNDLYVRARAPRRGRGRGADRGLPRGGARGGPAGRSPGTRRPTTWQAQALYDATGAEREEWFDILAAGLSSGLDSRRVRWRSTAATLATALLLAAPAVASAADADRDKVFDDLEAQVAPLADSDEAEGDRRDARARAARAGGPVAWPRASRSPQRFSLIDAVVGTRDEGAACGRSRGTRWSRTSSCDATVHALNDTAQASFGVAGARANVPGARRQRRRQRDAYSAGRPRRGRDRHRHRRRATSTSTRAR